MVKLEKSVQDNLNDLHDNHKMMISMKSASDKSKAVAEDVEKLSDDINFETLHINKVRTQHFLAISAQTGRFSVQTWLFSVGKCSFLVRKWTFLRVMPIFDDQRYFLGRNRP